MSAIEIRERADRLERRAKIVRERLLRAVDALDERRHQAIRITKRAKEAALPAVGAVVGAAALFGLSAACFVVAVRRRRRLGPGEEALRFLRGLPLALRPHREPSFVRRAAERVALTVLSFLATELARRATKNLVVPRRSTA